MASKENKIKIPLLTPEDIEVKVKQITKAGALALIYKTARTDRKYLNEVYGPMNWTSDYKVIKDNLYCGIGVREDSDHEFVWKWDCGIESRSDDEGNEKKGEASDAFKRAGFQWGIGEELYSVPTIWLKVKTEKVNDKYVLANKYAKYEVSSLHYDEASRTFTELTIRNADSKVEVFHWEKEDETTEQNVNSIPAALKELDLDSSDSQKTVNQEDSDSSNVQIIKNFNEENSKSDSVEERLPLRVLINLVGEKIQNMMATHGSMDIFKQILARVATPDFKCKTATEADYDTVVKILDELTEAGF